MLVLSSYSEHTVRRTMEPANESIILDPSAVGKRGEA